MNEINVQKSKKQKDLERQGHIFRGQELLDAHESDSRKPCYCGRMDYVVQTITEAFRQGILTISEVGL